MKFTIVNHRKSPFIVVKPPFSYVFPMILVPPFQDGRNPCNQWGKPGSPPSCHHSQERNENRKQPGNPSCEVSMFYAWDDIYVYMYICVYGYIYICIYIYKKK